MGDSSSIGESCVCCASNGEEEEEEEGAVETGDVMESAASELSGSFLEVSGTLPAKMPRFWKYIQTSAAVPTMMSGIVMEMAAIAPVPIADLCKGEMAEIWGELADGIATRDSGASEKRHCDMEKLERSKSAVRYLGWNWSAYVNHVACWAYASCKKVRPSVIWVVLAALLRGKYFVVFCTYGGVAVRSKLAYGSVMLIVGPPLTLFPNLKVNDGLMFSRA